MIQYQEEYNSQEDGACSKCGGSGKIVLFRNDWEEFDEIECNNCTA